MALSKQLAENIAETLTSEFNQYAGARAVSQLSGGYKVIVDSSNKPALDSTLRSIEERANQIAGRKLDRNDLEFKTGLIYF